jgi:low affinity Fe/Cu permease
LFHEAGEWQSRRRGGCKPSPRSFVAARNEWQRLAFTNAKLREGAMNKTFSHFATLTSHASGKPITFALSVAIVVIWALTGPMFGYSDTWQLVINTGTTIVTFLMVFLIQNTQNRDGAAIQAKLDEIIRTSAAQNRYIGIEDLTDKELEDLRDRCRSRADTLEDARDAGDEMTARVDAKARKAAEKVAG